MWVPSNYPSVAPEVRFCSFLTDKLNPNLYADGTICLSLLGSWYGDGVELWNPLSSNLLQVSIKHSAIVDVQYFISKLQYVTYFIFR